MHIADSTRQEICQFYQFNFVRAYLLNLLYQTFVVVVCIVAEYVTQFLNFFFFFFFLDVNEDILFILRNKNCFQQIEVHLIVEQIVSLPEFTMPQHCFVWYNQHTKMKVRVIEEIVKHIHIVRQFRLRNSIPFQFTSWLQTITHLYVAQSLENLILL